MEKIILKPIAAELVHKSGEANVNFDASFYQGTRGPEKNLGALCVISHIKYGNEDLSYLVSLVSSLANREYYSDISLKEQDPKKSFNRTLRKLNEVLEQFFSSKKFKINIGLTVVASENIYISRLGKFRVDLARNGRVIDILNNIELFDKDTESERQFSNIISGKVLPGDNIFAYFPSRSVSARNKQLNALLISEKQESFREKIDHLAKNVNSFSCCGIHIEIKESKEVLIKTPERYGASQKIKTILTSGKQGISDQGDQAGQKFSAPAPEETTEHEMAAIKNRSQGKTQTIPPEANTDEDVDRNEQNLAVGSATDIRPSELSVAKRSNAFETASGHIKKLGLSSLGLSRKNNVRTFLSLAIILVLTAGALVMIKNWEQSGQTRSVISAAKENIKLAQAKLSQNNMKEARVLLASSLFSMTSLEGKNIETLRNEANKILDTIDKTDAKKPVLFYDLNQSVEISAPKLVASASDGAIIVTGDGTVLTIGSSGISEEAKIEHSVANIFSDGNLIVLSSGNGAISTLDLSKDVKKSYLLTGFPTAKSEALYENNLYALDNYQVIKFSDAVIGGERKTDWLKTPFDPESGSAPLAIGIDGNVYVLTDDGTLMTFFKGEKSAEFKTNIQPSGDNKLFTAKDPSFIYLFDKTGQRIYTLDKNNGALIKTYKLEIPSQQQIEDASVSPDGTIWILSGDKKIWQIK